MTIEHLLMYSGKLFTTWSHSQYIQLLDGIQREYRTLVSVRKLCSFPWDNNRSFPSWFLIPMLFVNVYGRVLCWGKHLLVLHSSSLSVKSIFKLFTSQSSCATTWQNCIRCCVVWDGNIIKGVCLWMTCFFYGKNCQNGFLGILRVVTKSSSSATPS